jgi:glycosyltransferase involved in cell wall biosynthesis
VKKKIFVKGPVLSQSGYGEQARFALRALRSREDLFDIYVAPIKWGQTGWLWEESEFREWMDERITRTQIMLEKKELMPDISLQITIPNEFEKMCQTNIGYTAGIETTKCSPQWLVKGNEMDKILVVSEHAKMSYADTTVQASMGEGQEPFDYKLQTPIDVVHETTPTAPAEPIEGFELGCKDNFLMVSQLGPRKNFENALSWFVEEFFDKDVGLVIKTNFKSNSLTDFDAIENHLSSLLRRYENRKCKVYILHGDLTRGQMQWLYEHEKINALVNIAHGEGFGLPMFEAARAGMPIVTVPWSGQMDFLSHNGKSYFQEVDYTIRPVQPQAVWDGVVQQDSMWAFADQGSYKMTLRKTLKSKNRVKETAEELKALIEQKFNTDELYENFCQSILDTGGEVEEESTVVML